MHQAAVGPLNINKNHYILYITTGSLLFVLSGFLMLNLLHPFTIDSANADSKNTAVSLRIGESIMVPEVSTDSINIELDPTVANGDFKTASVTVGVSTNRTAGYTLTASVEGSETALTNADYDNYEIAALSTKTSADDFADLSKTASMNKWGYATDNNGDGEGQTEAGYYYAMPDVDNPTTLKITDGPAATSNTEVTFATKGKDLAAGKYENTVVFTAVGNIETAENSLKNLATEAGITTLQQMTSEVCSSADVWTSNTEDLTLLDIRTSVSYPVRKLADGNCWITQNLYLPDSITTTTLEDSAAAITYEVLPLETTVTPVFKSNSSALARSYKSGGSQSQGSYVVADTASVRDEVVAMCPKNWGVPSGSSTGQFYALYNAYGSTSNFLSAWNPQYAGVVASSSPTLASTRTTLLENEPSPQVDQTVPGRNTSAAAILTAIYDDAVYSIYHNTVAAFYPSTTEKTGLYIRTNGTVITTNYSGGEGPLKTVRCVLTSS